METRQLLIDNRFKVDTRINTVTDLETGQQSRLEPRLVKLLLLLTAHPGELVSREQIIREIWNDYGGAEEGLNQAISFLRKMFDDTRKERIKTIPKKGYLLNAAVTDAPTGQVVSEKNSTSTISSATKFNKRRQLVLAAVMLLIICVVIFGRKAFGPSTTETNEPAGAVEDTLYQYKELEELQKQKDSL
jgi:DNA-binding winged helix-turn-helix (wHTH) protein